jgi:hypothetical protein
MGDLRALSFNEQMIGDFDPAAYFDACGTIYIPSISLMTTEVWYIGRYIPNGEERLLAEIPYVTDPINETVVLRLKEGYMCALLFDMDEKYFDAEYNVIWDYASWPHINGREIDPEPSGTFSVIAVGPEELEIIQVYGNNWLKLMTVDGYEGWISISENAVRGYNDVMFIDICDMFEGQTCTNE